MPFPVHSKQVDETERKLGVTFPSMFRGRMMQDNGGSVAAAAVAVGASLIALGDYRLPARDRHAMIASLVTGILSVLATMLTPSLN